MDWAEQIKIRVNAEFDRVAGARVSGHQTNRSGSNGYALAVIAVLEDKRAEVMRKAQAGYFIQDWQELGNQVRQMIQQDAGYKTIKANQGLADKSHKSTVTGGYTA